MSRKDYWLWQACTSKYRENGLMHCLDLLGLQHVAREECDDQQRDEDEEGQRGVDLFLSCFRICQFPSAWPQGIPGKVNYHRRGRHPQLLVLHIYRLANHVKTGPSCSRNVHT